MDAKSRIQEPQTDAQRRLSIIQSMADAGFALFPLSGKIPKIKNYAWQKTGPGAFAPETLQQEGGNYGVALKPGDLVIDADPRNFKTGDDPLKRLISDIGAPLSGTFVVQTGGGGLHIYLSKSPDIAIRKSLKEYPGIDFLSSGAYVVGPGSIHPDSKREYTVISKCGPESAMEAPDRLSELIHKEETAAVEAEPLKEAQDADAGACARFSDYLAHHAPTERKGEAAGYKTACRGRDLGLSAHKVFELMVPWNHRCTPSRSEAELKEKIAHAYKYAQSPAGHASPKSDFTAIIRPAAELEAEEKAKREAEEKDVKWILTEKGGMVKCFHNLLNFFKVPDKGLYKVFGFNEFTSQAEFIGPAPWHHKKILPATSRAITDQDLKLLKAYMATKLKYESRVGDLEEAISVVAHGNKFHPVRGYLESLKWDKMPRLDGWLIKYGHTKDTPYTRAIARKFICGAVARVVRPGCIFAHALVLEGDQGIGKTRMCKALGGEWYGDIIIDPHSRDTVQNLKGRWIVELSEMEVARRTEANALKAFISRDVDTARLAYGRLSQEYPRQCVFIGTINPEADRDYLKDATGNRRFWPVDLCTSGQRVDVKGLQAVRNQLFAEAVEALRQGETLYLSGDVEQEAKSEAAERHAEHPWTERIAQWLDIPVAGGGVGAPAVEGEILREFTTAREVFIDAIGGTDRVLDRRATSIIADVLMRLGWKHVNRRVNGVSMRGYRKPKGAAGGSIADDTPGSCSLNQR